MASPSSKRPRPGPALAVFLVLLALVFGGIVANAQFNNGQYLPRLGLDLAGGTTVTLTAVTESGKPPPERQIDQAVDIIRQRVNGLGIAESQVSAQGDSIIVQVPGQGQRKVVEQVGQTAKLYFRQVMISGPGGVPEPTSSPSGTSTGEPTGEATPTPGETATAPGETATPSQSASGRAVGKAMERRAAPTGLPTDLPTNLPTGMPTGMPTEQGPDTSGIKPAKLEEFQKLDCTKAANRAGGRLEKANEQVVACGRDGTEKYILGPAKVLGTEVTKAEAVSDPQDFGKWKVVLNFNGKGTSQFGQLTTAVNKEQGDRRRVAIELDHLVMSAPNIEEPILGGTAEISGSFTQESAQDLSNVLRYGALPLQFKQSSIESVSPTLGRELLNGGLVAGLIGLGVVAIYVFLYYRGLGLVSVLSLLGSGGLTFGVVVLMSEFIGYRLSLAGIGGLIVAIGITADSFIVYFERLRDEVREGKSLRQATERSWVRARRTILTADTVTFLAALILYIVSVDQVRGFAFTLGLTTLVDVIVVFLFTKPLMTLLVRTRFFGEGHPMSGLDPRRLGAKESTRVVARRATPREA
ncbi:MAG: protein translocase subunit SecD [Streptosporangiales bacterium]|nr:protein translocase subunit SecD [Streptosporangiales bacterium]